MDVELFNAVQISIRSPLTRGDRLDTLISPIIGISIRSPLTRGDTRNASRVSAFPYFNPLPSHEGRLSRALRCGKGWRFQSAPLSRGETVALATARVTDKFQSAPLSRGETMSSGFTSCAQLDFNPLPSHEGRPKVLPSPAAPKNFNPLPSHEGRR